jgi:uncharacterized membrane protein YvlD (DUF360 family)
MYQHGIGIERNPQEAFRLYKQVAEGKDAEITEREVERASNNAYLEECWSYCKQWARHLESKTSEGYASSSSPKDRNFRDLFRLMYIRALITNNPGGWFHYILSFLCRAFVFAIVIAEVLPLIPGFYFSGSMKDAVFLAVIFCVVNTVVTVAGIVAIPLYIVCVAILIYLGCDLPIIGLVLTAFLAGFGTFLSKLINKDLKEKIFDAPSSSPPNYEDKSFQPYSFRQKPGLFGAAVVFGLISVVLFNAISVRFLADFFPDAFAVRGWTTTFLIAITVTAVNYSFGKLMHFLHMQSDVEWVLALDWLA